MDDETPDPALSRTLRTWQVAPRRNPNFRAETWARIEAGRAAAIGGWWPYVRRHAVGWSLALVLVTGAAGAGGYFAGEHRNAHDRDEILATYVTAIDARAMSAAGR